MPPNDPAKPRPPMRFLHEDAPPYGVATTLSPLVRRVVAPNPSAFTYRGTGTFIVGRGEVAVIDAGPALARHIDALLAATRGETITHQFVTHNHSDHSPAARLLKEATGADIWAFGPHAGGGAEAAGGGGAAVEEGVDLAFRPDRRLAHGEVVAGGGWTLEAVFTPGHMANHLCFALREEATLFSGDHVMGWSTTVVSPPEGDMAAYMASLRALQRRPETLYRPTHGPAIADPGAHVAALIAHREGREAQIAACLAAGIATVPAMVERLYADIDLRLHGAARRSVLAHLVHMVATGRAACEGEPGEESRFHPM